LNNSHKFFHSFEDVALEASRRGWNTDTGLADFAATMLAETGGERVRMVMSGGIVRLLARIFAELERMNQANLTVARDAEPKSVQNPSADGYLAWLNGVSFREDGGDFRDVLNLDVRSRKIIWKTGCKTADALAAYGARRLRDHKNCGSVTVGYIRDALKAKFGLTLAP
jgi:hypothetical protein